MSSAVRGSLRRGRQSTVPLEWRTRVSTWRHERELRSRVRLGDLRRTSPIERTSDYRAVGRSTGTTSSRSLSVARETSMVTLSSSVTLHTRDDSVQR